MELIDPEQLDDFKPPKKDPKKEKAALEEKKDKVPKWKQETEQLRAALKVIIASFCFFSVEQIADSDY